jgi:hypothetical protein
MLPALCHECKQRQGVDWDAQDGCLRLHGHIAAGGCVSAALPESVAHVLVEAGHLLHVCAGRMWRGYVEKLRQSSAGSGHNKAGNMQSSLVPLCS